MISFLVERTRPPDRQNGESRQRQKGGGVGGYSEEGGKDHVPRTGKN